MFVRFVEFVWLVNVRRHLPDGRQARAHIGRALSPAAGLRVPPIQVFRVH
jgi:hypothetical protein